MADEQSPQQQPQGQSPQQMPQGQMPQGQMPQGQYQQQPQGQYYQPYQMGQPAYSQSGQYQYQSQQYAYQTQPGQYVYQGQQPSDPQHAAAPTIVVNVPAQKKPKVPTIIALIALIVLVLVICLGVGSCASMVNSMSSSSSSTAPMTTKDTIAVIHMDGTIMGSGTGYITPETVLSELQAAENDNHVKAIVLRINSGGGSAAGGEEIAQYVKECDKPVVVSCGDSCCSAAYRIAAQSDWIIASEGTSVGSIGSIITKYDLTALLSNLGIDVEAISSGSDKADLDYYTQLTDEQRQYYQQMVDEITSDFIDEVAEGRGLDRSTVEALATGEVWTGQQALDNGMIDQVGTYEDALTKAAELGGINGNDYDTVSFDQNTSLSLSSLI